MSDKKGRHSLAPGGRRGGGGDTGDHGLSREVAEGKKLLRVELESNSDYLKKHTQRFTAVRSPYDHRPSYNAGSMSCFHRLGRHCVHQARSAVRSGETGGRAGGRAGVFASLESFDHLPRIPFQSVAVDGRTNSCVVLL